MATKLFLKRDIYHYDYASGDGEEHDALCTSKDNQKTVAAYLKDAITASGFAPRVRVSRGFYDNVTKVYIKDLGGKFYISCIDDFTEAGGDGADDQVEVTEFQLGCDDFRASLEGGDVVYRKFEQIVDRLSKDLNQYAGMYRTLTKGEAKIVNKAA